MGVQWRISSKLVFTQRKKLGVWADPVFQSARPVAFLKIFEGEAPYIQYSTIQTDSWFNILALAKGFAP